MNVALIPVRGGSKSIKLKNIKPMCGRPLVFWTIKAACGCDYIDKVYVATDSEVIKKTIIEFKRSMKMDSFDKVEVIERSVESSLDTASTELVMLEFAKNYEFDNIVLIQATSPLLQSTDLDRGFESFVTPGTDSVLSVVPQKRFNWSVDLQGFAHPTNYDVFHRPRRQEFGGYLVENGAFYITSKQDLLKTGNRLSGNIKAVEMNEASYLEIDEPSDWDIIEGIMKKNRMSVSPETLEIKMFLSDCDGCLTDGGMYYSEEGDELKKFNTRDGMGFALLRERGIITGIVTSESTNLIRRRAEKLKLDILKIGCKDKLSFIKELCLEYNMSLNNVCYVGDDINDIEVVKTVGYGCCPKDAIEGVKLNADYVAKCCGGGGVIREVADIICRSM